MKIQPPQLPDDSPFASDFTALAHLLLEEESPVEEVRILDQTVESVSFRKLDTKRTRFENCAFLECDFTGASFVDVVFLGCNFSNSRFSDGYFCRCSFAGCKFVGADLSGAVLRQITIEYSNLRYACFDKAKLTDLQWTGCDCTEASLGEVKWKNFTALGCRFERTSFFLTPLSGFDFTANELLSPICSAPPAELRGAKVTPLQAVELAGLLGVIIVR